VAWAILVAVIATALLLDLFVIHRRAKEPTPRRALIESVGWIGVGIAAGIVIAITMGANAGGEYLSGYLIEKSLSVDNVFVWALIFAHFSVPVAYQHRVLFWGIFGALALRFVFITAGVELVERFDVVLYLFGAFLLWTAIKLLRSDGDDHVDPDRSVFLRIVRSIVPSTDHFDSHKLFTIENGRRLATPLFAVLVVVETTDVLFAVDSVPAVLAVSDDRFVIFASNAFAILGLRALYFLLATANQELPYLKHGLAVILAYVGIKMLAHTAVHIPTAASLGFIALVLAVAIGASLRRRGTEDIAEPLAAPGQ
jgi:tellurite resistance protein TerC